MDEVTTITATRMYDPQTFGQMVMALLRDTRRTKDGEPWWIRARWLYLRAWLLTRRLYRLDMRIKSLAGIQYSPEGGHAIAASHFASRLAFVLGLKSTHGVCLLWTPEPKAGPIVYRNHAGMNYESVSREKAVSLLCGLAKHWSTCEVQGWGPPIERGGDMPKKGRAMRKAGKARKHGKKA